jgi:wobble nucleotide-excising tRNase
MALRKFVSIQNIGRFHNSAASGDVELKKLTLVYGENGRGKTTLCAILRSMQSGEAAHIMGRQTLGASSQPSTHVLLHGASSQTKFQNGGWTVTLPQLAIYDQTFISENVYLGDGVGTEQKRNLYKVIVGRDAVQKAQRLDQLVKDIRTTTSSIRDATKAVESHLLPGLSLKTLMEYPVDPTIDAKITQSETDLRGVVQADEIVRHVGLEAISLPHIPSGIAGILGETLDTVSASVDQQISAHLNHHSMRSGGQAWIAQGLDYRPDEGCPFCGQSLNSVSLIEAYKVLFSDSYRALKERITAAGKDLAERFGEQRLLDLDAALGRNRGAATFWNSHANFVTPDQTIVAQSAQLAIQYREAVLKLLRLKVAAPLERLEFDEEAKAAERAYEALIPVVTAYNAAAAAANVIFETRKTKIGTMKLEDARAKVQNLKTLKRRHEPQLKALCDTLQQLTTQKVDQEKERDAIKVDLDKHSGDLVGKYQRAINRYLDLFNAGFSISKVDHNYVGGVNASYHLMINRVSIPLGDDKTPLNQPSFKNTLSSGDRSTLALALFLAQLENDATLSERVVVLDDPFNSQDSFRTNQTAIEIARLIPKASQVIVLSHDARFLKEVTEKALNTEIKTLKLNPIGEATEICELDLENLLRSEVRTLINILQMYVSGGGGSPGDVIQKIRPLLEAYCKNSCITQFEAQDILSGILTKIRTAGATHPLSPIYNELNDVNDYTCRFHHADGTVTGIINETELRGYSKRALRVVGAM